MKTKGLNLSGHKPEKPMTRDAIKKLIHKEVEEILTELAKKTLSEQSNKLESAVGFYYTPPVEMAGDDEAYNDHSRKS